MRRCVATHTLRYSRSQTLKPKKSCTIIQTAIISGILITWWLLQSWGDSCQRHCWGGREPHGRGVSGRTGMEGRCVAQTQSGRRGCVKYYVGYTYGNELIELLNTCAHTGSACTCSLQHCSNHTMNENWVQQEITNCVKITRARATSLHPCAICVRKRSKPLLHHYIDSFSRERCLNGGHHLSSKMLSPSRSEAL